MQASEFVQRLRALMPATAVLEEYGLSAEEIANRSLWAGKGNEVARNGADLAGGQQYHEFFRILCGNL